MSIVQKIETLMKKKGVKNKTELSQKAGIPYTTVVNFYVKGTENIKLSTIQKLAIFFECSIDYLVSDTLSEPEGNPTTDVPVVQGGGDKMNRIMLKKDFTKITGKVITENGQEYSFKSATDLVKVISVINTIGADLGEIIITGKSDAGGANFKFWTDEKRPNWGCIAVDENRINQGLVQKLSQIKAIVDQN